MPLTDFIFDPSTCSDPDYDSDLWRQSYKAFNRYLEDLSPTELQARYEAILRNKASHSSQDHVRYRPHNDPRSFWYWVRREDEIEEEFRIRGLSLPNVALGIPSYLLTLIPPVARRSLQDSGLVARFSPDHYLWQTFDKGRFRIKHARGFRDSGLNDAQRDEELIASTYSPSRSVMIQTQDGNTVKPNGNVTYQRHYGGDAYVLCAATEFDPWLFHYFQCDACMIVTDVEELRVRLDAAFQAKMSGFGQVEFLVGYIDEHNPNAIIGKIDDATAAPEYRPLVSKALKYAYQKEFRFLWYSNGPASATAPDFVDIETGSLRDIARYYRLDASTGVLAQVT